MLAGLRRLLIFLVATAIGVGVVGAGIGFLLGSSVARSLSVAYYVVGALSLLLGFFAGVRGPLRPRDAEETEAVTGMFGIGIGARGARRATRGERQDTVATAGIFLSVGVWLILLGVLFDSDVRIL